MMIFSQKVLSTKQPKERSFFFFSKEHKKLQPIKFLLFPAGGTRDRTKEKKETLH
jgi:hypothetical protein